MYFPSMLFGTATIENSVEIPQKTKNRIAIRSSNPSPGIYSDKIRIQKDTHTPIFTAALFTIAKTQNNLNVH